MLLLLLLLLQLLGVAIFTLFFFPSNNPTNQFAHESSTDQQPPFHKLVFVLIDALRSDLMFANHSQMHFAKSLIQQGKALPFTALAQPPTVTLPRLKAITTGTNPQFIDALLNLHEKKQENPSLQHTDSWLRQLIFSNQQRKALFYGDDTWLRLFPSMWFNHTDPVSSFYVSDTEIVDHNVTRHLDQLLTPNNHWDILILHYLGLDHVGHLGGSKSPLMGPKQVELDLALARIFNHISIHDPEANQNTLLVVAGDHGMTDAGNHGGSSIEELSTALLFASPSFNHDPRDTPIRPQVIQQVDIVPTLTLLFGTGIPPASIGVAIHSVLELAFGHGDAAQKRIETALKKNAVQLLSLLQQVLGGRIEAVFQLLSLDPHHQQQQQQHHHGSHSLQDIVGSLDVKQIRTLLRTTQQYLLTRFSGHNMPMMVVGLVIMTIGTSGLVYVAFRRDGVCERMMMPKRDMVLVLLALLQVASLASTSFIEEEHEAWFFLGASSLLFLAALAPSSPTQYHYLLGALLVRIMRGWSHNGQKAGVDNSISNFLQTRPYLCHLVDPIGIYYLFTRMKENGGRLGKGLIIGAGMLSMTPINEPFMYLSEEEWGNRFRGRERRARMVYGMLAAAVGLEMLVVVSRRKMRSTLWLAILVLLRSLTRKENYAVLWLAVAAVHISRTLRRSNDYHSVVLDTWLLLVFAKTCFFALGGSNSLATVDLSNGYNGLEEFSIWKVGLLTFMSNFSGPIIVATGLLLDDDDDEKSKKRVVFLGWCFQSVVLLMISGLSAGFVHHLFVFSVFSPAVLIAILWLTAFLAFGALRTCLSLFFPR